MLRSASSYKYIYTYIYIKYIYIYIYKYLSISISISIYLSISISISTNIYTPTIYLEWVSAAGMSRCEVESVGSAQPFTSRSMSIDLYIYIHLSIYLSIYIYISISIYAPKIYLEGGAPAGMRRCEAESVRLSSADSGL